MKYNEWKRYNIYVIFVCYRCSDLKWVDSCGMNVGCMGGAVKDMCQNSDWGGWNMGESMMWSVIVDGDEDGDGVIRNEFLFME